MRPRTAALLAATLLVPLACGGDDGPDAEAEGRAARDAVAAFEEVLTSDGFEAEPDDDDDDSELEFESEACRALDELLSDDDEDVAGQTVELESESFGRESEVAQETVEGSLTFADSDALLEDLEIPDDQQAADCLEEAVQAMFEEDPVEGLEIGEITAEIERPDLGDGALHFHLSAEFSTQGVTLPFAIDVLAVAEGRRGATVSVSAVGVESTVDPEQLVQVLLTGNAPA